MMKNNFETLSLVGQYAKLEPLAFEHCQELLSAANFSRSTFDLTDVPSDVDSMNTYISTAIKGRENGTIIPFTVRDKRTGKILGSTRFANLEYWKWRDNHPLKRNSSIPDALEIGWAWLSEDAQRTGITTDCAILLLTQAFEGFNVHRVTFKTDSRNERSRRSIERLGAKLDGVIRYHMPAYDGQIRDSAFYSIISSEWASVSANIRSKLR